MRTPRRIPMTIMACTAGLLTTMASAYQYELTEISDFNGWSRAVTNGQITLHASGASQKTRTVTSSTADAFYGVVKITAATCPDYCMARISRFVGTYKGNNVLAETRVYLDGSTRRVHYRIRTFDPVTFDVVEDLVRGDIGNREMGWTLNTDIGIALGIKGNELVFYGSNQPTLQKVEFFDGFTPYSTPLPYRFDVYTETAGDSITATFSNFFDVSMSP